jgi:Outer membrane protein beta-barrel domain
MKTALTLLLLGVSSLAHSQKSVFGFDIGVNITNQRSEASRSGLPQLVYYGQPVTKFAFGIFYQFNFSKTFSIRPAIKYNGLGCTRTNQNFFIGLPVIASVELEYLTVPISFIYNANPDFRVNAGGYVSRLISGSTSYATVNDLFYDFDWGAVIGLERDLFGDFFISVNYFMGLANVYSQYNYSFSEVIVSNRNLQISVGYRLPNFRSNND